MLIDTWKITYTKRDGFRVQLKSDWLRNNLGPQKLNLSVKQGLNQRIQGLHRWTDLYGVAKKMVDCTEHTKLTFTDIVLLDAVPYLGLDVKTRSTLTRLLLNWRNKYLRLQEAEDEKLRRKLEKIDLPIDSHGASRELLLEKYRSMPSKLPNNSTA